MPHISAAAPGARLASEAQVKAIYNLSRFHWSVDAGQADQLFQETYQVVPAQLTARQASEFIAALSAPNAQRAAG